jgi:hypothetical protein
MCKKAGVLVTFKEFEVFTVTWWKKYYENISSLQEKGLLDSKGGYILFPNMLIVTCCTDFYVVEFVGATKKFTGLNIKWHNESSIYRYLSQFDEVEHNAIMNLNCDRTVFQNICLAQETDFEDVKSRFPYIELGLIGKMEREVYLLLVMISYQAILRIVLLLIDSKIFIVAKISFLHLFSKIK